jgi:hypothetical protein
VTAKQDSGRRFHVLYDKVWREDILAHAFALSLRIPLKVNTQIASW